VLLILLLLGLVVLRLAPSKDRLTSRGKKWILGLRFVSLLLLALLMFRPALVYTETFKLPASLYLLLDCSESMSVRDESSGKSRFEHAKQALQDSEKTLQQLQKRFDLHPFLFDQSLHPLEMSRGAVSLPETPTGKETAIGFALDEVFQRAAGKRLLATILLSDGTQRTRPPRDLTPRDAAVKFRDANFPLYTVSFGKSDTPDNLDIAVRELLAAEHIFVKNELVVSGQIRVNGFLNKEIPVRLLFETSPGKMEVVASKKLTATEEGQLVPYRFTYIPQTTGLKKVSVVAEPQPKEVVKTNNEMSSFVRVMEGGLNVLYLEGSSRYEQLVLRKSIDSSADIRLKYHRFPVEQFLVYAKTSREAVGKTALDVLKQATDERPSLVKEFFTPGVFTVYMIGDLPAAALKDEELKALADCVTGGSGLVMLGGYHSFGAGGYAGTPLAAVLPVVVRAQELQPLGEEYRKDIHWEIPLPLKPTDVGVSQNPFLLGIGPSSTAREIRAAWDSLPPLKGANRLVAKQGAIPLIAGPDGPERQPLLVQQISGAGRTLAFAGDTTWRWWADHEKEHKRFWRQVILWLAKMDESMLGDCWIELDKPRFAVGETVRFKVQLRDDKGKDVPNPKVEALVRLPDGKEEPVLIVNDNGIATGSVRNSTQPGDYTIRVTASAREGSSQAKNATARFLVFEQHLELDNPVADPTLLGNLAGLTGGKSVLPEKLPGLLQELAEKAEVLTEKRETKLTLYDSWPMLVLLCSVLALEWFVRKRVGMV